MSHENLEIASVVPYNTFHEKLKIFGLWNDFCLIGTKVYKLLPVKKEYLVFDYLITSACIEAGYALISTSDSVILFDLHTQSSCMDPSHSHLERQLILYRGISPPKVLFLDFCACVYIQGNIVLYSLEGTLKGNFESEMPEETILDNKLIVNRFLDHLVLVDLNNLKEIKRYQFKFNCIGKGSRILLGIENNVLDMFMNPVIDVDGDIIGLYSIGRYIFIGLFNCIEIFQDSSQWKKIEINTAANCYYFSEGFILYGHAFEDNASILKFSYEIQYEDDFENHENSLEEKKIVEENSAEEEFFSEDAEFNEVNQNLNEISSELLIPQSHDINVVMTFEPTSNLLNNFSKKQKKAVKKGKIADKPVTFHKKIKSSGYGTNQKQVKKGKNLLVKPKQYPLDSEVPSVAQEDLIFPKGNPLHNGPIFNIQFNKSGTRLASCGGDNAAYILKLPISKWKNERIALVGHENAVNFINWSADNEYILSTSNKYSVKLWGVSGAKPGECLLTLAGNYSDGKFYYVDKFIAVICGSEMVLNRYKLRDPFFKDDVKRLQAKCLFKPVLKLKLATAQGISRIACHNSFHSHIILAAGTNKSISVWDIDKQSEVRNIQTIHRKLVHTLRFYTGSEYIEGDSDSSNLFCCSGSDNYVSFYDLRTPGQPVLLLGHVNTALELGASISPCKRFVASGSEDKSAYIWDIRSTNLVSRLKGFKEVTNDIAWNPLFPQVCVAGNDGHIKFFNDR